MTSHPGNYEWTDNTAFNYGDITNKHPWIDGHIPYSTSTTNAYKCLKETATNGMLRNVRQKCNVLAIHAQNQIIISQQINLHSTTLKLVAISIVHPI